MIAAPPVVLDVAAATVEGHRLLGLAPAAVRAALGPPTRVERYPRRLDLVYGGRLEVVTTGTAWSVVVTDPRAVEPRLGRLLAVPPRTLERRLAERTALRQSRRYRCDTKGCFGTFFSGDRAVRVIYGVSGGRRYVALQRWPLR